MDMKVKLKISLLGKVDILVGTGAAMELHALMPAMVAIRKE